MQSVDSNSQSRRRELNERYPVRYAVSAETFPEGTSALIVHDPHSQWPRTVVLSPFADDRALAMADAALAYAEEHAPVVQDRRILRVTSQGDVYPHAGESDLCFALDLYFPGSTNSNIVGPFLRAAERGHVIDIGGAGRARVAEP